VHGAQPGVPHVRASSITSVKDLIGKSSGRRLGSGHELAEEVWLEKNGVNPSQVKFVPSGRCRTSWRRWSQGASLPEGFPTRVASAQTDPHLHFLGWHPYRHPRRREQPVAKGNANTIVAYLEGTIEAFIPMSPTRKPPYRYWPIS